MFADYCDYNDILDRLFSCYRLYPDQESPLLKPTANPSEFEMDLPGVKKESISVVLDGKNVDIHYKNRYEKDRTSRQTLNAPCSEAVLRFENGVLTIKLIPDASKTKTFVVT